MPYSKDIMSDHRYECVILIDHCSSHFQALNVGTEEVKFPTLHLPISGLEKQAIIQMSHPKMSITRITTHLVLFLRYDDSYVGCFLKNT